MLSRRTLVSSTTMGAVVFMGACAGTGTTPAQIVTDVQNAVSALASSFSTVLAQAPNVVPATTAATITSALAQASAVLGSLSTNLTANAAAPLVQQIESALNTVISAAAAVPLIPPPFSTALGAAAIVLPIIEAWLSTVLPAAPTPAAASLARAKLATPGMTVAGAEATLKQMAGR
jgi:hypothetical protein